MRRRKYGKLFMCNKCGIIYISHARKPKLCGTCYRDRSRNI